jgi:hypothetical protein
VGDVEPFGQRQSTESASTILEVANRAPTLNSFLRNSFARSESQRNTSKDSPCIMVKSLGTIELRRESEVADVANDRIS